MLLTTARPKPISRRTSYYPARLEFHRYPQLISECCTAREFGPPPRFLGASTWSWIDRRVSGCVCATNALFRLAFTVTSSPQGLNQATHSTLVGSFFNRNGVTDLRPLHLLVSIRFQILFHRPPGLLFNVPSLYWFTIGQEEYLALPHRRGCFLRGFSGLVVLWIFTHLALYISSTGLSPSLAEFSNSFDYISRLKCDSLGGNHSKSQQHLYNDSPSSLSCLRLTCVNSVQNLVIIGLGLSRFARHYSGNPSDFLSRHDHC